MPFRSEAQRKLLWAKRPDVAREWTEKYGSKPRPKKAKSTKKRTSPGTRRST